MHQFNMWHGLYCGGTEAVIPRARAGLATTWDTNCRISCLMSPLRLRPDDADDTDVDAVDHVVDHADAEELARQGPEIPIIVFLASCCHCAFVLTMLKMLMLMMLMLTNWLNDIGYRLLYFFCDVATVPSS